MMLVAASGPAVGQRDRERRVLADGASWSRRDRQRKVGGGGIDRRAGAVVPCAVVRGRIGIGQARGGDLAL